MRRDNQGHERILAALAGLVVVASPVRPAFNASLVDRYLYARRRARYGHPFEQVRPGGLRGDCSYLALRRELGFRVLQTSTTEGGRTNCATSYEVSTPERGPWALMGLSGVGKTSLVQALLPEQDVGPIGEVSEHRGRGDTRPPGRVCLRCPVVGRSVILLASELFPRWSDARQVRDLSRWETRLPISRLLAPRGPEAA